MNKILVTRYASALRDAFVSRLDLDRIFVASHREGERMEEAIVGFGDPFANEVVGQVTVVANGDVMMAALLPGIHVVLHHVTIDAGFRIVAQITGPFAISKRKRPDTR